MLRCISMHDGKKGPAGPNKKPSKAMIAVISIVLVLLLLVIIGVVVGNRYLDKIDIDPADPSERTTLQVDPEVKKEAILRKKPLRNINRISIMRMKRSQKISKAALCGITKTFSTSC